MLTEPPSQKLIQITYIALGPLSSTMETNWEGEKISYWNWVRRSHCFTKYDFIQFHL